MKSEFGEVAKNLCHAIPFVEQAVQAGAKLILLPEFMPSGFTATQDIWNYAETLAGPSVTWLLNTAKHYRIYLGFTFVESDQADFYNTFVLSSPDGRLLGTVRKNPPCSRESYFFKAGSGSHVIETKLGKIGIGICYENLLFARMRAMHDAKVDFVLLPSAAERPVLPSPAKQAALLHAGARSVFVAALGVPVIIANATACATTALPENLPFLRNGFPSSSSIVDGNGKVKAEGGNGEGIIVGTITLAAGVKRPGKPKRFRMMWAVPVPWHAFMWWLTQKLGEYSYRRNAQRTEAVKRLHRDMAAARIGEKNDRCS